MMELLPTYILAGGRSSRFGSDKARALVNGQALLARTAGLVQPVARSVTVVADAAGKYQDLGLRTIADRTTGQGPLGGLAAALEDLRDSDLLLLVSCDLLEFETCWVEMLWAARTPEAQAVAFQKPGVNSGGGGRGGAASRWEPLLALYHRSIKGLVSDQLSSGHRAMWRLLDRAATVAVPTPADWPEHFQANTPEALQAWLSACDQSVQRHGRSRCS